MVLTEQQSSVIEYIAADHLKPSQYSLDIYGDDGYHDLIDSIKELGIIQALYINNHNEIISGHRRWMAAKTISPDFPCPVIRKKYSEELDEKQAIIEFNRYRVKTGQQLYKEGKGLEGIYQERAKERQGERNDLKPDIVQNFAQCSPNSQQLYHQGQELEQIIKQREVPKQTLDSLKYLSETVKQKSEMDNKTRTQIAQTIGLGSGEQWRKLDYVAEHKPALLPQIKTDGMTIHKAYTQAKREEVKEQVKQAAWPSGKYRIIYADPPWQYGNTMPDGTTQPDDHYPLMSIEQICNLPVKELSLDYEKTILVRAALDYGLDPLMGELTIFQGKPFVSIDGRLRKAHETELFDGIESRPATEDERKARNTATGNKLWRSEVFKKGCTHGFVGWGEVKEAEMHRNENLPTTAWPDRMAEKRSQVMALRLAFYLPLPSFEDIGNEAQEPPKAFIDSTATVVKDQPAAKPIKKDEPLFQDTDFR